MRITENVTLVWDMSTVSTLRERRSFAAVAAHPQRNAPEATIT